MAFGLKSDLEELQKNIKYYFNDCNILMTALTHSSYANEHKEKKAADNERLEFLGDSLVSVIISEDLYNGSPALSEGELTKLRAAAVCEQSLFKCANLVGLGDFLLLGKGEEAGGGRSRPSILADAFEALVASIYLDSGIENARKFLLATISISNMIQDKDCGFIDYKTILQEIIQKNDNHTVYYSIIDEKGPDHKKLFTVDVSIDGIGYGTGTGRTKKAAEQSAARDALQKYKPAVKEGG